MEEFLFRGLLFFGLYNPDRPLRVYFFFSSRRRHTRFSRDWSSTCALPIYPPVDPPVMPPAPCPTCGSACFWQGIDDPAGRSEERREGKECRSRWSPYH